MDVVPEKLRDKLKTTIQLMSNPIAFNENVKLNFLTQSQETKM
jgi:hypothetical protein